MRKTQAQHQAQTRVKAARDKYALWGALAVLGLIVTLALTSMARAERGTIKTYGISTFGDLKYDADFKHWDYVNPDAPKGGEFSTWAFGTFDSLTPYILKGNAAVGATIFYDTLMTGNLEEPDAQYGLLAQSIEYPENREWVIYTLRPEAKFNDGTPVTAEDVVFSYEILVEEGRPSFRNTFRDFLNVEALDAGRVKFTFNPEGPLRELILTAGGIPVFSKAYYENREFGESTLEAPLGSGPYVLGDVDSGRSVTYKRRDDYWGKDLPVNVGQNNFDELTFEYYSDYTAAFEAFKGGAYLYREEYSSSVWATGYNFPAIADGTVKVETLPDGRPAGTQGFWFNMRRDKFTDPDVREAIGMAFNFEWSNDSLFYGLYQRTDSFWENSATLQAEDLPSAGELELLEPLAEYFPDTLLTEPAFSPRTSDASSLGDRRALRRASGLLDSAGWEVGDDGFRYKDGEKLTLEFLNDSPTFDRIISPFVANLERLGVDAKMNRVDPAEAQEREKNFDYDVVTQRFSMSQTPGDELEQIFGSRSADVPGGVNVGGLSNAGVDSLLRTISNAETREELDVAVRALDRALRSLHIWVPQWYNPKHNIAYRDVYARPYADNPPPLGLGVQSLWWWDEARADELKASGALR